MIPFAKLIISFALMLLGIRFRIGLGTSILAGSLALGLMFGVMPMEWGATAVTALQDEKAIFLAVIIGLILVLSDLMDRTGQGGRLMERAAGYLRSPRLRLVFFPALIGLLPMPGGAVFSAPMVESVALNMGLSAEDKVLVNYWFRHVWELAWPLYPGIILASSLANIPLGELAMVMLPGPVVMVALGWIFILRPGRLRLGPMAEGPPAERRMSAVLWEGAPLLTAIGGAIGLEGLLPYLAPGVPFELGVAAALAAGIAVSLLQNRVGPRMILKALSKKSLYSMIFVVVAVFVYKDVLQKTGAIGELAQAAGGEAALIVSAVFLPALVGMISGIALAYVGASFPLMLGLLGSMGLTDHTAAYMALALFSGMSGIMASPLHICFLLTCEYFKVDAALAWRRIIVPCCILLAVGLAYFYILL